MPRSKFATKTYGPTKPKICENSLVTPGTLAPGPGLTLSAHFRLNVQLDPVTSRPLVGAAILTRQPDPTKWFGTTYCGGYLVSVSLVCLAPAFAPRFEWHFYKDGDTIWGSVLEATAPRSIDPWDSGELRKPATTYHGWEMIRAVALT